MNQLKNKNVHTSGTDPKSNRKFDTLKIQIHDRSRSLVCTYNLTKGDGGFSEFYGPNTPTPLLNPLLVKLTDIFTETTCLTLIEFEIRKFDCMWLLLLTSHYQTNTTLTWVPVLLCTSSDKISRHPLKAYTFTDNFIRCISLSFPQISLM